MTRKTPLVLSVLILFLLAVAYWDEQKTIEEKESKRFEKRVFRLLEAKDVKSLRLFNGLELAYELAQNDLLTWNILQPIRFDGNQELISTFVKSMAELRFDSQISEPKELKDYGLDQPSKSLELGLADGTVKKIHLGMRMPVGKGVYFKVEGIDKVFVSGHSLELNLNRGAEDYRDRSLGVPPGSSLRSVEFTSREGIFRFERIKGQWAFTDKDRRSLDQESLRSFLATVGGASAQSFIDNPSQKLRDVLNPKSNGTVYLGKLSWSEDEKAYKVVEFFENNETIYATKEGYKGFLIIDKSIKAELSKTEWDFADKRIVDYDSNDIEKIVIDENEFVKTPDGNWHEQGKADSLVEHPRLLVLDFEFAKATAILESFEGLKAEPDHRIGLTLKGNVQLNLEIWQNPKEAGEIVVKKSHDQSKYYLASDDLLENLAERKIAKGD